MQVPEKPVNEDDRLAALELTKLLDTAPEPRFDRLTRLAQLSLNIETVLVSLVDENRQWFKSKQGLTSCETDRDVSFCGHAILDETIFEIPDALKDKRFADNPLVLGEPFIRFYAGVPLKHKGHLIGTLCFKSSQPRTLSATEREIAIGFAAAIEQEIQDRLQEHDHEKLLASELMYRSVMEGTQIGTWQWNVQTGETVFNERWAEILGYQLAELEPVSIDTWLSFAHPDDLVESGRLLQEHFDGVSSFYDCKCRMKHKNGDYVWVHDRGRVVSWTQDGKPLMMYGTHADISEQKMAELSLLESRDQFETLVANIPGITFRCKADKDWTMLFMSGHIDPLSGYPSSDFINNAVRTYDSVIHPDDKERIGRSVELALSERSSWVLNYRILHANGSIRWVEERGAAEYDESGQVTFLDGFILDVSNEKKLQDQLVKLTQQLPGVVYQFQLWPDGRSSFPYASDTIKAIYGVTPEEVADDATAAFARIYPDDLEGVVQSINHSRDQQTVWQDEYRVYREDQSVMWLSGNATPESMADGSTLWHGYIQDVTQTKEYYLQLEQLNQQLSVAQQSLDLASEQAQMGYWQASLKNGTLWWSPSIYQIFGFDPEKVTPSVVLFKSMVHPDDVEKVEQSEEEAKLTGVHNVEHRIIRSDGEIRWVHELAQLVPEAQNPELVMVGSVQDITERMKLQQMKEEFISTVSHELRTPLTSISGALNLLQSTGLVISSEKAAKLIGIASNNCNQLIHLISDLLDIEKLVAGKMSFEMRPVNIRSVLQRAMHDHQLYSGSKHIHFVLDTDTKVDDINLVADEHRLMQILANFLSNAVKYSPSGGRVTLSANKQSDYIEIAVEDEGEGVPEAFRSRIFQRFSQADAGISKMKGGTGLGLSLCKELAEGMGGSIGYTSIVGCGARFYVRLPISTIF